MALGDFYLAKTAEAPGLTLRPDATIDGHEAWLGTARCMMIASLKVRNGIDGKGRLPAQVERAEKRMGLSLKFAGSNLQAAGRDAHQAAVHFSDA